MQRTSNFDNGPKNDTFEHGIALFKSCKIQTNFPKDLNIDLNDPSRAILMIENVHQDFLVKIRVQRASYFDDGQK